MRSPLMPSSDTSPSRAATRTRWRSPGESSSGRRSMVASTREKRAASVKSASRARLTRSVASSRSAPGSGLAARYWRSRMYPASGRRASHAAMPQRLVASAATARGASRAAASKASNASDQRPASKSRNAASIDSGCSRTRGTGYCAETGDASKRSTVIEERWRATRGSVIGRTLSHGRTGPCTPPTSRRYWRQLRAMTYRVATLRQHPRLERHFHRLHRVAWPPFLRDDAVNALWPRLYDDFPAYQIALRDDAGRVVAIGNTIPFIWNGTPRGLPDRVADVIAAGIDARESARRPNTLSALAAIVDPRRRAEGLSARIIRAMRAVAVAHGLGALVAPVRPSLKGRYPLTPMARYAAWIRPDGWLFDPWLRVHQRLGASIVRITPRGNTVRATVTEWEERTGLTFPDSGRYVVPDAFQPIVVDRARNRGRYEEANVWMLHPIRRGREGNRGRRTPVGFRPTAPSARR